jgi:hypothetical protein
MSNSFLAMIQKNNELHKEFSNIYKFIGSGKFMAAYYDAETNLVYKVFKLSVLLTDTEHSRRVTEYPEYVFDTIMNAKESKKIKLLIEQIWKTDYNWPLFCKDNHYKIKHIPKVFEIIHYPEAFGFAYVTEHLESINKYSSNRLDYIFVRGINYCFYSRHHNKENFFDNFSPSSFSMTQDSYLKRLKYVKLKELKKLSNLIFKNFKHCQIDLHSKNVMFRKQDNCLVINDPLY